MIRRLALVVGSIGALGAAAVAALRGRSRGKGRRKHPGTARLAAPGSRAAPRAVSAVSPSGPQDMAPATQGAAQGAAPVPGPAVEPRAPQGLRAIRGIGAVIAERLREAGVTTVDQVAAWSPGDVRDVAERIGVTPERIVREDWVGQARSIAGSDALGADPDAPGSEAGQPPKKGG